MEFRRTIYKDLLKWKNTHGLDNVLVLQGAHGTGKTFILQKFARENYKQQIYVNTEETLQDFSDLYTRDTILIIDEVDGSERLFSKIRKLARNLNCDVVVAVSRTGMVEDMETLTLYTLSFEEFLDACGVIDYNEIRKYYEIYATIGGYPDVVKEYIRSGSIAEAFDRVKQLWFSTLATYWEPLSTSITLEQVMPLIAAGEIPKNKKQLDWLHASGIIEYDSEHKFIHFLDNGLACYFLLNTLLPIEDIHTALNGTFLFRSLVQQGYTPKCHSRFQLYEIPAKNEIDHLIQAITTKFSQQVTK